MVDLTFCEMIQDYNTKFKIKVYLKGEINDKKMMVKVRCGLLEWRVLMTKSKTEGDAE